MEWKAEKEMLMMLFPGSKESAVILILLSAIFTIIFYSNIQLKKIEIRKFIKKYEMYCEFMETENLQELRMVDK